MNTPEFLPGRVLLPFPEMEQHLREELSSRFGTAVSREFGPFLHVSTLERDALWAQVVLRKPFILRFDSIGNAAKALSSIQRNWASCQYQLLRKAELVSQKLPFVKTRPRSFPCDVPSAPMGVFALIDDHTILASAETSSPFPAGKIDWLEDHKNPPSRAYLKFQDALTLCRHYLGAELPASGSRCLDAGACPGGWTWVLRNLGADVLAIDRSELAPALMRDPHVRFREHDAFTLKPQELGAFDWVVSDVICYPQRLLPWVESWLDSGLVRNMVCTIKLQGQTDWELIEKFTAIPDSLVLHMYHNKHELTFLHSHR